MEKSRRRHSLMTSEHNDESLRPSPRAMAEKLGRFSLRELFILMGLVCVAGGFFSWARTGSDAAGALFMAAVVANVLFVIYVLTRWPVVNILAVTAVLFVIGACLLPSTSIPRGPARRMQCSNHLKQIGLALQNYHDTFGCFPPAYVADAKGRPMHSWRVLILPFIEQKPLYDKYRFDEPWDGPNNSRLHNEILHVYCCPSRAEQQSRTETSYVAVMGPQTVWPGSKTITMSDVTDGTSNTILVVEIANSGIHWMEPRDLHVVQMPMAVDAARGQGISSQHPNVAMAVFVDGHTQALTKNTPPEILRALLTIAGGETIGDY
jgi:prepilin-type processing-associated H-X9-DG protein